MKKKKKRPPPKLDLSDICTELSDIEAKLIGLHELLLRAVTYDFGSLKLDPALNGIGEILKDETTKLGKLARMVDEHSVCINLKP